MSNVSLRQAAGNMKLLVSLYFLDGYLQLACPKSVVKMVILFLNWDLDFISKEPC